MSMGIYKPGQGYWVRVLTAALIAVVTLAAAGWVAKQMERVADKLPRSVWTMRLEPAPATAPKVGESVTLFKKGAGDGAGVQVGRAEVASYDAPELRVKSVAMEAGASDPSEADGGSVRFGSAPEGPRHSLVGAPISQAAVEPALIQGLAAGVVLLIGAMIAYWATAMHQKFVDFLIATDGEMKKVNWSTARDIRMSTIVVIFAAFVLSLSLFVVDLSFQWIFTKAGILVH